MEKLAAKLGVPSEKLPGFAEVYDNLGERGAKKWDKHLGDARAVSEVDDWLKHNMNEGNFDLGELSDSAKRRLRDRLVFSGVYGIKSGLQLDETCAKVMDEVRSVATFDWSNGYSQVGQNILKWSNTM
eukprot:gene18601-22211_t